MITETLTKKVSAETKEALAEKVVDLTLAGGKVIGISFNEPCDFLGIPNGSWEATYEIDFNYDEDDYYDEFPNGEFADEYFASQGDLRYVV
jgi:hypothetical protein